MSQSAWKTATRYKTQLTRAFSCNLIRSITIETSGKPSAVGAHTAHHRTQSHTAAPTCITRHKRYVQHTLRMPKTRGSLHLGHHRTATQPYADTAHAVTHMCGCRSKDRVL